jgi:hypothetical protein
MLLGKDAILKWFDLTGSREFTIYAGSNSAKNNPLFKYEGEGGVEAAKHKFSEWADLCSSYPNSVEYVIHGYPKGRPKTRNKALEETSSPRDIIQDKFYLKSPYETNSPIAPVNNIGAIGNIDDIKAQIKAELERETQIEELEEELSFLEEENERLQSEQNKFYHKLNGIIEMVTPVLMQKMTGTKATSLAGINEVIDINPETLQLKNIIDRLKKSDPEIIFHLDKLAKISETKPAMFSQLIIMLNGIE